MPGFFCSGGGKRRTPNGTWLCCRCNIWRLQRTSAQRLKRHTIGSCRRAAIFEEWRWILSATVELIRVGHPAARAA